MQLFVRITPTAHSPLGRDDVPRGVFTYLPGSRGSASSLIGLLCPKLRQIDPYSSPSPGRFSGSDLPLTGLMSRGGGSTPVGVAGLGRLEKVPLARCFTLHDPADHTSPRGRVVVTRVSRVCARVCAPTGKSGNGRLARAGQDEAAGATRISNGSCNRPATSPLPSVNQILRTTPAHGLSYWCPGPLCSSNPGTG
jgi:hypothetical protein